MVDHFGLSDMDAAAVMVGFQASRRLGEPLNTLIAPQMSAFHPPQNSLAFLDFDTRKSPAYA